MSCYGSNIAHHHINIGEDVVVDTLQNVVGSVLLCCYHLVGVVDKSLAKRFYFLHCATDGKLRNNVFHKDLIFIYDLDIYLSSGRLMPVCG